MAMLIFDDNARDVSIIASGEKFGVLGAGVFGVVDDGFQMAAIFIVGDGSTVM